MADLSNDNDNKPRWDVISNVYEELEKVLCEHVNNDKLTFIELETIIKLMSLKLLSAEIKHLTMLILTEFYECKDERCYA